MQSIAARFRSWNEGEEGQALLLFAVAFVILLGFVGFSVDVGRYMWAKGELQSTVDSAALAAAQSMPQGTGTASTYATAYWDSNKGGIEDHATNTDFVVSFPAGNRAVKVDAEADVTTWFLKFFGVDSWHVEASGKAESQVLDIALVLDVSGSMCFTSYEPVEGDGPNWKGIVMGPGRNNPYGSYPFPQLAEAIPAGGSTITIKLNSVGVFATTDTTEKDRIFGDYWSNAGNNGKRYHQIAPNGARAGIIQIDDELFQITGIDTSNKTLTVTRGMTNLRTGLATAKVAHSVNSEVWANRSANGSSDYCDMAARNAKTPTVSGPFEPFDSAMANGQFFIGLFNPAFDKIGVARYSNTGTIEAGLTGGSFASLNNTIDAFPYPSGGTNIAHGLSRGRTITTGPGARPNGVKILVLLTDGAPTHYCSGQTSTSVTYGTASCSSASSGNISSCTTTTGVTHAINQAAVAKSQGITVYTIGLGDGVIDCTLEQIAAAGGGLYYKAPTPAQLDEAFSAIAAKTRVALTE